MKSKLLLIVALLLFIQKVNFGQAPTLGSAASFALFSSVGSISNTGITHITGNVGTNSGLSTGFGNIDGSMHDGDGVSALAASDLTIAYNQLDAAIPTFFPAPLLGGGATLVPGVYYISSPATLDLTMILDGLGDPTSVFIFQIDGAFATNANAKVKLVNGALACNVFWKVEGLVSMAAGTSIKGTIVANNAAITMSTNDTLEGRALSTAGAITTDGVLVYTPIGCGSPVLTGPAAPNLASVACYAIFSSIGPVTNVGVTYVTGDIGSDNGLTTGYNPLFVTGAIHPVPDGSTAVAATDLVPAYNYLNTLPFDIELLYPAQFGNNLVLTPHTYRMNAAATFTDTLFLNAQGDPSAVFVIQINGALSTSTYAKVVLLNGAQAANVFWKVEGALTINDYSIFNGTVIVNNGAINLNTGATLNGRALTTTGAVNTAAVFVTVPVGTCGTLLPPVIITEPNPQTVCSGSSATFSVTATGSGLTYQWRKGSVNLIDGGNISGATTPTLTINPATLADAAIDYNVIVSGTAGPNDTSMNVSLTITSAPIITLEPLNQVACAGDSVSFTTTASGAGLTYQWRKGTVNLINGGSISGATTATLTINPVTLADTAFNYNVIVMGGCSPNDTSLNASLIVNPIPVASANSNSPVCTGDTIMLSASTVSGATYSWTSTTGFISTAQNPVITSASTSNSGNYTLVVTSNGCTSTPSTITVTVNDCFADLSITKSVNNSTPFLGETVTFTIVVTNNGPSTATGVEVFESLQSGFVYLSSSTTAGSYSATTGIWTVGTMNNGDSETLTITATVATDGNYINTAIVYGDNADSDMTNNNASIELYPTDFFIPEGFSPNGDGINDVFFIRGISNYPDNTITIFNRWGSKVFSASPYNNTWGGKCDTGLQVGGDDLPIGTYFYVLDLGNDSDIIKGTIYLNK